MTVTNILRSLTLLAAAIFFAGQASAATITQWNFNTIGVQAAPYNTPAPTTGSGTLVTLGMTNSYNGGNTASADVVATTGTANTSFTENTWRCAALPITAGPATLPGPAIQPGPRSRRQHGRIPEHWLLVRLVLHGSGHPRPAIPVQHQHGQFGRMDQLWRYQSDGHLHRHGQGLLQRSR